MTKKICENCKNEYRDTLYRKERRFCSRKCYFESIRGISNPKKSHPSPNKGVPISEEAKEKWLKNVGDRFHNTGRTRFKKGLIPWNKHLRYSNPTRLKLEAVNKYKQIHYQVNKKLGKPNECSICGMTNKKGYHWANKSGNYDLNDMNDWIRLCISCHYKYDGSQKYGASLYKR